MFVSFLLPFAERGAGPLHHWVMLAQMARFHPDEIIFVADAAYFDEANIPFGQILRVGGLSFKCPGKMEYRGFRKIVLDHELLGGFGDRGWTHLDLFRVLLKEPIPELVAVLRGILQELMAAGDFEAALVWSNFPSLRAAMDELGGGVIIHNELGPLRGGLYRETFYFDLHGVNGRSTPAGWTLEQVKSQMSTAELLDCDELRGILLEDTARAQQLEPAPPMFEVGVALQVEDDSNTIAYANGWDSLSLLYDVMSRVGPDDMLVRSHPGAHFIYRGGLGRADDSRDSLEFIEKVKKVVSINSSMLIEAAFWGRAFEAKGDSPVVFLAGTGRDDAVSWRLAFNAFFLGYLVPSELLFLPEYYRWRLGGATLAQCHTRHLLALRGGSIAVPRIAGFDVASAGGCGDEGLVRLPPIWTAQTSLDRQVAELRFQMDAMKDAEQLATHWEGEAKANWAQLQVLSAHAAELNMRMEQALAQLAEAEAAMEQVRKLEIELATSTALADKWQQEAESNGAQLQALSAHAAELNTRMESALARAAEAETTGAAARKLETELATSRALAEKWQQEAESSQVRLREQSMHIGQLRTSLDNMLERMAVMGPLAERAEQLDRDAESLRKEAERWRQQSESNGYQVQELSAKMAELHLQLDQALVRVTEVTEEMELLRFRNRSWLKRVFQVKDGH